MSEEVHRVTEIVGASPDGVDAAISSAIKRASTTLRHLHWFEVAEIRGQIVDGAIAKYQVTLKVGFRLDDG